MGDDLFDLGIEGRAIDHHHVAAAEAHDFDIGADAGDLKPFAPSEARVWFLHLHFVIEGVFGDFHYRSSIMTAAGTFGKPGIVKMEPVSGMTKLAPAERRTSRIWIVNPVGAPRTFGSSERDCGVLATQI